MPALTLTQAQTELAFWLAAEQAIAVDGKQSYAIAGRAVTRVNLREIGERVAYYYNMVNRLSRNGPVIQRVVPLG
jgi:Family of unknown function (DUF6148)